MTEKQKSEILRMRSNGATYKRIADMLCLSLNTVKSHCNRNNIKKVTDVPHSDVSQSDLCINCGRPVIQKKKVKRRKFCCTECRVRWWNSHPEEVNRKAMYKNRCAYCGSEFTAYGNKHRKYCSHQCYIKSRFGGKNDD